MEILREPAFPRGVLAGDHALDRGDRQPVEQRHVVGGPAHRLPDDADDQGGGRDHQAGVGREVGGDLDAVAPRADAHPGGSAVGAHHGHRNRQEVGQQVGEAADVPVAVLSDTGQVERDVVMRAVGLESDVAAGAPLPLRELAPHEGDLLPEVPHHAGGAAGRQLDDRGDHLDDPAVEVHGASGRELERALLAPQQRALDERGRVAPELARVDLDPVEEHVELGLHPGHGQAQARRSRTGDAGPRAASGGPSGKAGRVLFDLGLEVGWHSCKASKAADTRALD